MNPNKINMLNTRGNEKYRYPAGRKDEAGQTGA